MNLLENKDVLKATETVLSASLMREKLFWSNEHKARAPLSQFNYYSGLWDHQGISFPQHKPLLIQT